MPIKFTVRALFLSLISASALFAQSATITVPTSGPIPLDPAVRVGVLPNGLKYYVRANKKPEKRAELRLVVSAGSLMEDDDQRGLAHFLEHMAFNGTKNFPKHKLVDYLESIGMQFGADLNAATSYASTVYMLQVPTDTGKHLETGLQILEDWAHNVSFDSAEVESERPIIVGEWRSNLGAGKRIQDQQIPIIYKGSRYPDRLPIGLVQTIETASRDKLVRFYNDWYRPDLISVIAVGDFDPMAVEAIIREKFARIPKAVSPRKHESYSVPTGSGTVVSILSDPEITSTRGTIMFKGIPHTRGRTVEDYRSSIVRSTYNSLLNQRLSEIARKPDAPFLWANSDHSVIGDDLGTYDLSVGTKTNELEKGLDAILTEFRRVEQHGFTQAELDRSKQMYMRGFESSLTNKDDIPSRSFAQGLIDNFLDSLALPNVDTRVAIGRQLVPTITLDDVNKEAKVLSAAASRTLLITLPEKPEIKKPVENELIALMDAAVKKNVTPYTEAAVATTLIEKMPKPGNIVSETRDTTVGVIKWKLSNGARVLLKPTTLKADQILLAGYSPGGYQIASDADYINAMFADDLVGVGGFGKLSLEDLRKSLTGKLAGVQVSLNDNSETVSGSASAKDLETMFQLLYLNFTDPRYDSAAVAALIARAKASIANRDASPGAAFGDTVNLTMVQHHPRVPIITSALWDKPQPKLAYQFYRERFANASDFTFLFVGSFTPDSIKPFVERYLASLPGTGKIDKIADPGIRRPSGVIHKVVRAGKEPQATTLLIFHGPFVRDRKEGLDLSALTQVLNLRLLDRIREQLGGSYGVQVQRSTQSEPVSTYTIQISFVSAPERLDELVKAVLDEMEKIKREGPTETELAKVKEGAIRSIESSRQRNETWMTILNYDRYGWPLAEITSDAGWKSLTVEQIKSAAQKYINQQNYARFDLLPAASN